MACCLVGCQTDNGSAADSESAVQALRQQLATADPHSFVGLVIAVRPEDKFVAVGDVPVGNFHEGDAFVIVDSKQNVLAHGTVRALTADAVHLKYVVAPGGRDPRTGDFAVHFSE
jgi:hypothetical protein